MRTPARLKPAVMLVAGALLVSPAPALAAEAPIKEIVASHAGWEVDKTTKANVCTVASADECQPGKRSSEPGGFAAPQGVAVNDDPASASYHHVYVIDIAHRVQELSPTGQLISTFGWEVNETKDKEPGASQAEKNICTAASADVCKAGVAGSAAGQFGQPASITVDPPSGAVYVSDSSGSGGEGFRVQKFTADGHFLLELGKEVNETTHANRCTAEEQQAAVKCTGPAQRAGKEIEEGGTKEHEAFSYPPLLVVNPAGGLYVGEQGRVQLLGADDKYTGEISLTPILAAPSGEVGALAADTAGDLYLTYFDGNTRSNVRVFELAPSGAVTGQFEPAPREPGGEIQVQAIALDPAGRLAVAEYEVFHDAEFNQLSNYRGVLYSTATGHLHQITEFSDPVASHTDPGGNQAGINALAFSDADQLYATFLAFPATGQVDELIAFSPVPVAELLTTPTHCAPAADVESDATFECGLGGEVNPFSVTQTTAWFQWGLTAQLGQQTPRQTICTTGCSSSPVAMAPGVVQPLRPNEMVNYRGAGEDANAESPELLTSDTATFTTPTVAPRVVGSPSTSFVRPFSAVMSAAVNPENAGTRFFFEYAPEAGAGATLESRCPNGVQLEACEGVASTAAQLSSEYGAVGATLEARSLQPATTYRYRLMAVNSAGEAAANETGGRLLPEGTFTTAPAPAPLAVTLPASDLAATSATVSGSVDPQGHAAVYQFRLGVYNGAGTQFGVVSSGSAGAGTGAVQETLALSGLQPGTTYAYKITVSSGAGFAEGQAIAFTTAGLPSTLAVPGVLAQVAVPGIAFPPEAATQISPKKLTRAQQLARAVKACRKKPKARRGACIRKAHRQYGPKTSKKAASR